MLNTFKLINLPIEYDIDNNRLLYMQMKASLKFSSGVKFEFKFIGEKSLLRALMVEANKFKS